ncbi:enoyl-CoA hydratase [Nocardia sp. FBN12]|uniref:enoyl-CoA hydratase n=1 Tax=Nocardia sp. FBN12 TaxID=3419766 RepID=UPI003D085171
MSSRKTKPDYERIRYEMAATGVARVTLAREEKRNAQDFQMLYELDSALKAAMLDDAVKVVIVAADGPDFSSGHDLASCASITDFDTVTATGGFEQPGAHGHMATEEDAYLGLCWRWRNLPKPTIVQVQGRVIAGGLMLVWPFDLIVASEDASFSDPTVAFGVNGHEFFVHAWELGARKAKEMLFRSSYITAQEAADVGMVNHVVPRDDLESFTRGIAEEIAQRPTMGLKLAKQAVNNSLDAQGQWNALQSAFALHQIGHSHARLIHDGSLLDPDGAAVIRDLAKRMPSP